MAVQDSFSVRAAVGLVGDLARPGEPYAFDTGPCEVPSGGRKPRPGDGVIWDESANAFKVPTTDAEELQVIGIVSYEQNRVPNSQGVIEYDDGEIIKVCVMGTVFVTAGANVEYQQLLRCQSDDYKWDPGNPSAYNGLYHRAIECVSRSGANNGVIEARIGYGRTN